MAVTFLKRSTLPAAVKGKAGSLSVGITNMGQIILSKLATEALGAGVKRVMLGVDGALVYLFPEGAKAVAKAAQKDMIELRYAKKGGSASFSGSAILRDTTTFGDHLYDFKASGNQSFPVQVSVANGCITFTLPKGSIAPRPVVKRGKKAKSAYAVVANPEETSGTAVEEELVLDVA